MTLTELTRAASILRGLPASQRRETVIQLVPALTALAADEGVASETRVNLIVRALRAVSPRAQRPSTAPDALRALQDALAGDRGPGRPPIGPPTTVRLTEDTYAWLDDEARRRGLLDTDGQPHRPRTIRAVIDDVRQTPTP